MSSMLPRFLWLLLAGGEAVLAGGHPCFGQSPCSLEAAGWEFAGPATYVKRGGSTKLSSAGAIQDAALTPHGTAFVGSVNGGVWRTSNISDDVPKWSNVLDGQPVTCSSIAALHVSSLNPQRVYAGCGGSTSSEQGSNWNVVNSGDWGGIMHSPDGGASWSMIPGFPPNFYVTAILEVSPTHLLVAAQSHLFDANRGGVWLGDGSGFRQVSDKPTFTLVPLDDAMNTLVATHARLPHHAISVSSDGGATWTDFDSAGLAWGHNMVPFYTCSALLSDGDTLVVAGLTVSADNVSSTDSALFVRSLGSAEEWRTMQQPTCLDEDSMPKDRMALLGDPQEPDLLYVAGNAGAFAWRVNVTSGEWIKLWDGDVMDGSIAHSDCRNWAWDEGSGRLLLVSDGGIFARVQPKAPGGRWVSLNGDMKQMEYLSAGYDSREGRFVAGAQDNGAQLLPAHATPDSVALGFVEGDGTVTLCDNVHNPSRLYGTTQFLGVGTIDIDPSSSSDSKKRRSGSLRNSGNVGDDDDDCGGLCMVQGDAFIEIPLSKYFPEPLSFPFFVQPYALNSQDTTQLVLFANGTENRPSAFWSFDIPPSVTSTKDIKAPRMLFATPSGALFLDFVAGGYTRGKPDAGLVVGMSHTQLFVKSSLTEGKMVTRPLPVEFAEPVTLPYDASGARILGPLTHGRTVSMAVSPADSEVVAVTGWQSIKDNNASEQVFVSKNAGKTWVDVTYNLREASGVVGKVRPGGLLVVDLVGNSDRALLVSTANGVLVQFDSSKSWARFGSCAEFPIVLVAALSYEHYSDTIVAATFGRGIYKLHNAKSALLDARRCVTGVLPVLETSSARFFPQQVGLESMA